MKSNKKYRGKNSDVEVIVLTEHGPDTERPVYYAIQNEHDHSRWWPYFTYPLSHPSCCIEEVPEEPIGVGYSWTKNGRLYKVVYRLQGTGEYYVVVSHPLDGTSELVTNAADGHSFWGVFDIIESIQSD